ncbi:MAG: glycosyltransferase [Peptococcaceae bacterium]|nr:glycosyltransferase [Peptococcaceae bacterium]
MDVVGFHLYNVVDQFAKYLLVIMQLLMFIYAIYYVFLAVRGLQRSKATPRLEPVKRFAIVVAAHNEEKVIGPLIENLNMLEYPKELYDVFVVADNCTDETAKICRGLGANVFERFNTVDRGKGYALEWLFDQIFALDKPYDGIVIFDADNLVKKDFLEVMNSKMSEGCQIVQGYLDTKNPYDTWVTNSFAISFWMVNRMLQLARHHLKLSGLLAGTGMCISYQLLKEMGWGAHSLSEDLEFSARALMRGVKTEWAHDAVVYDEKPLGFGQSCKQRKRWAQGHVDVSGNYLWPLLHKGFTEKKWCYFDTAIHLFQPHMIMIGTIVLLIDFFLGDAVSHTLMTDVLPPFFWQAVLLAMALFTIVSFTRDRIPLRAYLGLILYPVFMYTWIPILALGFAHKNRREWSHTEHSRSISYTDIVSDG